MTSKRDDYTPRPFDPDLMPWEQQPGESDAAYASFEAYLRMEKRSVFAAPGNGHNHSRRWSWVWRVGQWDRHMARLRFEEMENYQRDMNKRHREAGRALQAQVYKWLQLFQEDEARLAKLHPRDAIRMFEVAVKVERDAAAAGDEPANVGRTSQGVVAPAPPMIGDENRDDAADDAAAASLAQKYGLPHEHDKALASIVAEALMGIAEDAGNAR